jgi:DNA-binding transcriptional LysR family regulator
MATLPQLKTFVTVVDQGGFTAAARRLGLSQPAISRAVTTLEKELGLPLLNRGRDGLSLTTAGTTALTHAREALRHMSLMHSEVASVAGDVTGTLSIASLPTVTATVIAPQLREFAERHPAVDIRLLEGSEEEVRDWLDQGAAEAGVVSLPARGLQTAPLRDQRMVAVAPADSWLASKEVVSYAELSNEPFVLGTGGCAEVFNPVARQAGVEFDIAFQAREVSAVLEIVRAGLGVSIVPESAVDPSLDGLVIRQLVPETVRHLGVAVSASASAPARAFLAQVEALDLH